MPNSASGKSQRKSDEILAGEYVLGALPIGQLKSLDERMRCDQQFAAVVGRWRRNLQRLEFEDQQKSQAVYEVIYGRADTWSAKQAGLVQRLGDGLCKLWRSNALWRTATTILLLYVVFILETR